jgi:hypothetical protein
MERDVVCAVFSAPAFNLHLTPGVNCYWRVDLGCRLQLCRRGAFFRGYLYNDSTFRGALC